MTGNTYRMPSCMGELSATASITIAGKRIIAWIAERPGKSAGHHRPQQCQQRQELQRVRQLVE